MSRTPAYLKDRTALVTGGASGLGLQTAEALGTQGARVVISARKADVLQSAQAHLAGLGVDASWIAADSASEDDGGRLAGSSRKCIHTGGTASVRWKSPGQSARSRRSGCVRLKRRL